MDGVASPRGVLCPAHYVRHCALQSDLHGLGSDGRDSAVRNLGDLSRFGSLVFQIVMPLELIVTMFLAAVTAASAVSQEKDRRTLILLLLTRLTSSEIVLGKLTSSLIGVANLVFAALPLLLVITLLGGVSVAQVLFATGVVLVTSFWAAALANLFAFWREKTFQTLALTMLAITGWLVFCEAIAATVLVACQRLGRRYSVQCVRCGVFASRSISQPGPAFREVR